MWTIHFDVMHGGDIFPAYRAATSWTAQRPPSPSRSLFRISFPWFSTQLIFWDIGGPGSRQHAVGSQTMLQKIFFFHVSKSLGLPGSPVDLTDVETPGNRTAPQLG